MHTAAIIERAEKQILLAQQARRIVNLLDDTPIVPGEEREPFANGPQMQDVMNDAETHLRGWSASVEPVHTAAGKLGTNAMPGSAGESLESPSSQTMTAAQRRVEQRERAQEEGGETDVPPPQSQTQPPYPTSAESVSGSAA